jgi:hypothetical protein
MASEPYTPKSHGGYYLVRRYATPHTEPQIYVPLTLRLMEATVLCRIQLWRLSMVITVLATRMYSYLRHSFD